MAHSIQRDIQNRFQILDLPVFINWMNGRLILEFLSARPHFALMANFLRLADGKSFINLDQVKKARIEGTVEKQSVRIEFADKTADSYYEADAALIVAILNAGEKTQ